MLTSTHLLNSNYQPDSSVLIMEPTRDKEVVSPTPAPTQLREPQAVVREIEKYHSSRATPHIDLLDPPVSQTRRAKVATNHREDQNASIIIPAPEPIKHEVLPQAQKDTTSPKVRPYIQQPFSRSQLTNYRSFLSRSCDPRQSYQA